MGVPRLKINALSFRIVEKIHYLCGGIENITNKKHSKS